MWQHLLNTLAPNCLFITLIMSRCHAHTQTINVAEKRWPGLPSTSSSRHDIYRCFAHVVWEKDQISNDANGRINLSHSVWWSHRLGTVIDASRRKHLLRFQQVLFLLSRFISVCVCKVSLSSFLLRRQLLSSRTIILPNVMKHSPDGNKSFLLRHTRSCSLGDKRRLHDDQTK